MSLGVKGDLSTSLMRSERINMDNIRDAGVTMFNSAGNEHFEFNPPIECGMTARVPAPWNPLPTTPNNLGGVVAVGGTGYQSNSLYSASSRGPVKWDNVDPSNNKLLSKEADNFLANVVLPTPMGPSTTTKAGHFCDKSRRAFASFIQFLQHTAIHFQHSFL